MNTDWNSMIKTQSITHGTATGMIWGIDL